MLPHQEGSCWVWLEESSGSPLWGKWTLPCFSSWAVHHPPEFMTPQQIWAAPPPYPQPISSGWWAQTRPSSEGKVLSTEGGYPPHPHSYHAWLRRLHPLEEALKLSSLLSV